MGDVIKTAYITPSFGTSKYGQAIEAIRVMREEMCDLEEPDAYNEFLKGLKDDIFAGKLGGERTEMWFEIRKARLGLVTGKECKGSEVDEGEGKEFMKVKKTD